MTYDIRGIKRAFCEPTITGLFSEAVVGKSHSTSPKSNTDTWMFYSSSYKKHQLHLPELTCVMSPNGLYLPP